MDSRSLAEQEKDIRDLLRRAERTPVKTSALRRDTLKRLIDLAHSSHTSLKIVAATNLKLFIKDFPELEDDAINAVYDLCEDPVATVRIKGYAAIVDVSREQSKWVKRNADVLVQLLQSDEPEEVTFVKRALTQHLDMDPVVTLGVLCDQIVPPDEPLDEEEQSIRDRLRSLVLAFLAGEAKRSLVDRHASTAGSPAEQLLVSCLFKAITKLATGDIDVIVKDIIASLPSFKLPSSRGVELLDVLLTHIRFTLKVDLAAGSDHASLFNARYYLDLAAFVAIDKRLAPPSHLLRFYYSSLTSKLVLGRLPEEEQAYVITQVARIFAAHEEEAKLPPRAPAADLGKNSGAVSDVPDDLALRRQFPEICVSLLQVFADMKSEEHRPWPACHILIQGIARRKRDNRWQLPSYLISVLRVLENLAVSQEASAEAKAAQEQMHSVIRQSLLPPVKPPAISTTSASPSTPSKRSADEQKGNVIKISAVDSKGDAHTMNGPAGTGASTGKGEQRRVMNVNKRKLDSPNGPAFSTLPDPSGSNGAVASGRPISRNGTPNLPASLPPRPSAATVASSLGNTPNAPRAERQRERQQPLQIKGQGSRRSPTARDGPTAPTAGSSSTAGSVSESPTAEGTTRSAKKVKVEDRRRNGGPSDGPAGQRESAAARGEKGKVPEALPSPQTEDAKGVPSLLSRLAGGAQNGKGAAAASEHDQLQRDRDRGGHGRRNKRERDPEKDKETSKSIALPSVPAKRRADDPPLPSRAASSSGAPPSLSNPRSRQSQASAEKQDVPVGGYSIRGAAKAANQNPTGSGDGSGKKGPGSLLERMQPQSEGAGNNSDGGRRKKRPRH